MVDNADQLRLQYKLTKLRTKTKKLIAISTCSDHKELRRFLLKWKCKSILPQLDELVL